MRPYVSGSIADRLDFKVEAEFSGPETKWMDLYLRLKDVPEIGNAFVGHFKEPFGLEQLTSSGDTTFLERALPNALSPGRSLGVMAQDSILKERATWAMGVFRSLTGEDRFPSGQGGEAYAVTGRTTWLAWQDKQSDELMHLGASYSYRSMSDEARYRQRPETRITDYLTDTGKFQVDATHLIGTEAAWGHGPLSLQGEYMAALANRPNEEKAFFHGAYAQASYFLTGEHRPYNNKTGVFEGPRQLEIYEGPQPFRPFPIRGVGAWEIATRYSFLDLRGSELSDNARLLQDITVGLNWYLNPNLRVGWNYIHSWVAGSSSSGTADIFLFRVQVEF